MISLVRLKKDVQFNTELTKVVDVLKGIAAARFHVLERQLAVFEQYFEAVQQFLNLVQLDRVAHPFAQSRTPVVGVVMVTSSAGFLGGLNSQVLTAGLRERSASGGALTVIGDRGASALRDAGIACTAFPGIEDSARLSLALEVRDHLVRQMLSGMCGRLVVVYPKPISFALQRVTTEVLLPCTEWAVAPPAPAPECLWESSVEDAMEYVVSQWLGYRLDVIFAWSRLSELAARAVHLEGSYQELLRRGKQMRLQYFRARHEVIDRSMREIFAAQLLSKTRATPLREIALLGEVEDEASNESASAR